MKKILFLLLAATFALCSCTKQDLDEIRAEQAGLDARLSTLEEWQRTIYNPQIQISAESETKRSIFREKDKTKRSKKESAQHSKSRNKSFVMTSVSAL